MSVDSRAETEQRPALAIPSIYGVRKKGGNKGGLRPPWERQCEARRSHGRGWCRSTFLYPNGRCRVHGGPSTGPRTAEGKARALAALSTVNADRAARKPEAVVRRLAAEGRSLIEIGASVPAWSVARIKNFLIEERNRDG
jgi:hypothetical protein